MRQTVLAFLAMLVAFSLHAQNAVFSSGQWYKLGVTQTGIHKIDFSALRKMGIDPGKVDPGQIRLFGNGGAMLPQANAAPRQSQPKENAIWIKGGEDGKLNNGDAIYFYAESPHIITYDSAKAELQHQINCYADTNFYFLTFGQGQGLRIAGAPNIIAKNAPVVTQFDDYWYHELETYNLLKSGREWYGEYLGASPANINVDLPGVILNSSAKLRTSAIGAAQVTTKFVWNVNDNMVGTSQIGTVSGGIYDVRALRAESVYAFAAPAASAFKINVTYDKNGQASAQAYLNYVALQVKRELNFYDKQQLFYFLPQKSDTATYQMKRAADGWNIWNVSNPLQPAAVIIQNAGSNASFTASGASKLGKYISFKPEQAFEPVSWTRIDNQDIAASEAPDLLIVSPKAWLSEARRLAAFRETNDGLNVLVVGSDEVYNEFSSGKPDATAIRDFVRMLYQKTPGNLKYLLLFGDATYDYRDKLKNQTPAQRSNFIPVYESRESLNPVYTYSSDDYYGFMEASEGSWEESTAGDHTLDIGVGRLPVKSLFEAEVVVDKLIRYESGRSIGHWRNNVKFVADDGDGNIHQSHADQLAKLIQPQFLSSRIFIDESVQTTTSEGQKAPAVNNKIRNSIDNGTLILNYTGHGGVSGWAEEQVLTLADMQSARGIDNLTLLFTATCDFGRYDDPGNVSGAEIMVLSPKGAAIGAISTTRPVYSSTNFTLSKAFYESLVKPAAGKRMGDFFRDTKNGALVGSLNRNFTLLADPSMKFGLSEKSVRWEQMPDNLRALQKVTVRGEICDRVNGKRDSIFDGTARVAIFDKQITFQTLGNEGSPENYSEFRSKLFDGSVTVKGGKFTCEFVMPKDIDYRVGLGRASVFAVSADSTSTAAGQLDLMIGGSGELVTDNVPPKISAYLNNDSFRNGDVVEPSPVLWVHVSDENGINISNAGIGHGITLTLNDTLTISLNDYFTANTDDYRSGVVRYPLANLPAGKYVTSVKVWDTYTNFSEIAFAFQVEAARRVSINQWNIYPNPFDKELSFALGHSRENEDVELRFSIFTSKGQELGNFRWEYYNSDPVIRETVNLDRRIPSHTMLLYRMIIRSLKDNSTDQRAGQIVRSP
ncbi:type IX secretion system sortase PorU [Dyadobacter luticola]|uniref:Type IX secretion system sortase PorU n=2 Tax=Dyadobacter luticola TaxID=1979387 RepID=A0A5R9KZ55_9BACT|nr:type IX secretion system sortase PorU [Dyadobacter luticola]